MVGFEGDAAKTTSVVGEKVAENEEKYRRRRKA
jgi:hypothetical protein